jgi:RHS repeat-associated protein
MTASVPAQGFSNHLTTYEYDPLYQLVKATYPNVAPFNGEVDSWTYDAIGNRLTNTVNGTAQAYNYQKITGNPNNWQRLLSDGANNYSYDLDGNAASRSGAGGTFNFTWSDQDRLITITGGVAAAYNYDWQGRRHIKQVAGTTTSHLYNGLNLIQELGASPADYLFGPGIDEPLAMSRGGQTYYYLTDALGSAAAISNTGGAVQNSYLHDAWGQVKSQTGSLTNPFTYTSREAAEAGLSFYRARYYQPSLGRFLSEDPYSPASAADPALLDRYSYVNNNPSASVDPLGLFSFQVDRSCGSEKRRKGIERAMWKAYDRVPRCLPRRLQTALNPPSVPYKIICEAARQGGTPACSGFRGDSTIVLYNPAFSTRDCGCLQATLIHELVHSAGEASENVAQACELNCFSCARVETGIENCGCR